MKTYQSVVRSARGRGDSASRAERVEITWPGGTGCRPLSVFDWRFWFKLS